MAIFDIVDFGAFYTATQAFWLGQNPYLVGTGWAKVFEPFWTYVLLAPFALFPFWVSRGLFFVVGLLVFMVNAIKMGANRWQLIMFLLSVPVLGSLGQGNIDWLVTAGLWMPPPVGMFFVLMKPQVGIGVAVYWTYMAYMEGGMKKLVKTVMPVTIAYLSSFLVYGLWILKLPAMHDNPANLGVFPWLVPVGCYLLFEALHRREQNLATISSPMFAPYLILNNLSSVYLSLFSRPKFFIFFWALLWLGVLIPRLWR